jgi:spore coat polysaccharide biosynthesis protein SpsF
LHIIIFSRLGSQRLKNKARVKLINKKKLIEHVIDQALNILPKNRVILATTKKVEDNYLCKVAKKKGIKYFRGSEKNVFKRTTECCKTFKIKYFLRYCGDRPIIDILKIKKIIKEFKKYKEYDLISTNSNKEKIDEGLTIEFIKAKTLEQIKKNNLTFYNKEHITSYFYKNYKKYKIYKISFSKVFKKQYKYSIDSKKDLKTVNFILKNYDYKNIKDVVGYHEKANKHY